MDEDRHFARRIFLLRWRTVALAVTLTGVVAMATASGCSKRAGVKKIRIANPGGWALLANGYQQFVIAQFWTSVSPEPAPTSYSIGTDRCRAAVTDTSHGVIVYANVGTALTITGQTITGQTITAVAYEGTSQGYLDYEGSLPYDGGMDWTITNSGGPDLAASTIAILRTPTAAVVAATPTLTPGSPATVTWTGAADADAVTISVGGNTGVFYCDAKPDGAFTIPASVTAAAGPNAAVFSVISYVDEVVRLNGRDFILQGATYR